MEAETFVIKSLAAQNSIMLAALSVVILIVLRAILKRRPKHLLAALIWTGIVIWFFNSPYFGFSEVSVSRKGIRLNYGVLSFRNDLLPTRSPWNIETVYPDIRKMKKVYFIRIGDRNSMRVKGSSGYAILEKIGQAIERKKPRETPPVSQGSHWRNPPVFPVTEKACPVSKVIRAYCFC